ncbi:MAG: hypothetical protein LBC81_02240, partial [Tannerellaceae bacterium]|nr:hypothetical protein [Tannerellaceae bacterium]
RLNRRIGDMALMKQEVKFWQRDRNNKNAKIEWRFTNDNAKIKLKKLYPTILLDLRDTRCNTNV